jgi:hypothetical protein
VEARDANPDPGDPIEVRGDVRRIAILTVRREPCACYLARRFRDSGAEVFLVSQRRLKVEHDTPAYYRRLWNRRGPLVAADAVLLFAARSATKVAVGGLRGAKRLLGGSGGDEGARTRTIFRTEVPVLREDPDIVNEDWLTYLEVDNINSKADRGRLEALEPDLILLAGAPILSRRTIRVARVACMNPHCGITPEYAGSSPIDRAIYERRFDHIGYTVHLVVPTVDAGPVIHQERIDWDPARGIGHLWPILAQKMYDKLADLSLELMAGRALTAVPQTDVRVNPPAGLAVRTLGELRRIAYARRRAT